jgi:pimeloyl-ACP methyl ester carboxylesterase
MEGNPMSTHSPVYKSPEAEARAMAAYDAAMELWPIPYEALDVPTRFGNTHVIVSGPRNAPPFVLLHCSRFNSAIWSPIIADLSRDYRTYAVDVIGDAGRTVAANPPTTYPDLAEWLVEAYRELGIEQAYLMGWSFGGFVAMNFAVHKQERVKKLVLLAPFATFVPLGIKFMLRGFMPSFFTTRSNARRFERWMSFKEDFGYEEHSELFYELLRNARPLLVIKAPPRTFTDEELQGLKVPTLLLVGDHEVLFDPREAVQRARLLPNGEAEIIPDCNHALVSDQTEWVSARVLRFLGNGD